jgi:hypothetical protein
MLAEPAMKAEHTTMTGMWAKAGVSGGGAGAPAEVRPRAGDVYFSADVETDGPIPGPYSMLSFALVPAGTFDGKSFQRPKTYQNTFYSQLRPISDQFEPEALAVNGLDRDALLTTGTDPAQAMRDASRWITNRCGGAEPVLVAYPLSFDWSWLYWYFIQFTGASPFKHSRCFDVKTAVAVKCGVPVACAGRKNLPAALQSKHAHTHHAVDDAIAQAEIFANIFEYQRD